MHWVEMLPDTQTPSWLGLPSNAEKVLLTTQGTPPPVISFICTLVFCHWTHNTSWFFFLSPSLQISCFHRADH